MGIVLFLFFKLKKNIQIKILSQFFSRYTHLENNKQHLILDKIKKFDKNCKKSAGGLETQIFGFLGHQTQNAQK